MARSQSPERVMLPDSGERTGERPFARYISGSMIARRTRELAGKIGEDYVALGVSEVHMVTVAVGGMFWSVDLAREIGRQHPDLGLTHDVVRLGSYGQGTTSSGTMREYGTLGDPVGGRHVMVVDEVVDTGNTLSFFLKRLAYGTLDQATDRPLAPASIAVAALVDKPDVHNGRMKEINYVGVAVPGNPWLVGYGMDHAGHGRSLPAVYQSARPQDQIASGYTIPQTYPPTLITPR